LDLQWLTLLAEKRMVAKVPSKEEQLNI